MTAEIINPPSMTDTFDVTVMREHASKASALLKALSNENRLMVMCKLVAGEMCVTDLNDGLDLSQSALSQHLAILREKGLVKTRREAQTIYYRLADGAASAVMHTLHEVYCADAGDCG